MKKINNNILKYPGSKWNIADWVVENLPDNYCDMTYLEPFFGSGSVFFNKQRSKIETINDIDSNVYNLFKIVRDKPNELAESLKLTPWSREEYENSSEETSDEVEKARKFIVRMWQAIGAKTSDKTGWRNNITAETRTILGFHSALPEKIYGACERLKHTRSCAVQIEHQDVFKLIERYDREDVIMYLDPPYVISTRSKRIYKHEFTNEDHEKLLKFCIKTKAKILISGYESELYNEYLKNWEKEEVMAVCETGIKKKEVLWKNYKNKNRLL